MRVYLILPSSKQIGLWDNTIIMTYSEFGRRANENGSRGTDHGMAAPHFLLGSIKGGIFGSELNFNNLNNNNLAFQVDYRSLYNHVLYFELPNNFSKFKSELISKKIWMSNNKSTKIIATIGPASNHENILLSMVKGVNAFRLNFSHGDFSQHLHSIEIIRAIENKLNLSFQ